MSKSPTDKSTQSERPVCTSLNAEEPHVETLRSLERENRHLRDVVVSLAAMVLKNLARAPATGPEAAGEREPGSGPDVLSRQFLGHELLTEREQAVLAHIVRGASSREAARLLSISVRTVEFHRANIMLKLGARNTAELVRIVVGT
jgi:DNA-binding CsgD family transcriptional regulator